jgi:hypothetical protein
MAGLKKGKRLEKGKSLGAQVGRAIVGSVPGGQLALAGADIALGLRGKAGARPMRRRRSRGMYMRKGRLFMGYSQREVKMAMRRTYGGRTRRRT